MLKLRHVLNGMVAVLGVRMRVVMAMVVIGVVRVLSRSFVRGRVDHELEGVPGGGEFGDVVLRVGAADVLLHRAEPLLLLGEALLLLAVAGIDDATGRGETS